MKLISIKMLLLLLIGAGCNSRVETIKLQLLENQKYDKTAAIDSGDFYLSEGNQYYLEQKYDSARISYHKAFAVNPHDWRVSFQMGKTAVKYQFLDFANDYFEKSLQLSGKDKEIRALIYQELGDNLVRQNRFGPAKQKYLLVLQLNPNSKNAEQSLLKLQQISNAD